MNEHHKKVLTALADSYSSYEDFCYSNFAGLSSETGLDRKQVRKSCRFLMRKGLAQFGRGLWTDDGEPAGSGYAATKAGAALVEAWPRKCEGCFRYMADPPSHLCVGCQAYREHQA
jgi:hypothetical protein